MKRIPLVVLGAVVAVVTGYGGYHYALQLVPQPVPSSPVTAAGASCPLSQANLHDAAGRAPDISRWRGKAVLLNFWASWCGPCRREMPALQTAASRYASRGLQVVGVAVDEPAAAQRLAREVGVRYPLLYGQAAADELLQACSAGRQGLPMSVVLDGRGRVCAAHAGALDEAGFVRLLRPCLAR